jgi:ribonuclease D
MTASSDFVLDDRNVQDVQVIYSKAKQLPRAKQPSLRRVCEDLLGMTLDKTHQCSDWDTRPLSQGQVIYAALDAHVLRADLLPQLLRFITPQAS